MAKSIPYLIKLFTNSQSQPPEELRNIVTNVFLKPKKRLKWQKDLLKNPDADRQIRYIKEGYEAAIYNAIILCYLINDSGKVRELIDSKVTPSHKKIESTINIIKKRYEAQYIEFFFLNVTRESIDAILDKINTPNWDPLRQKLPSPFSTNVEASGLSHIALYFGQKIPWSDYLSSYNQAIEKKDQGELKDALEQLKALEKRSLVRISIVTTQIKQLSQRIEESTQQFNYLKDF